MPASSGSAFPFHTRGGHTHICALCRGDTLILRKTKRVCKVRVFVKRIRSQPFYFTEIRYEFGDSTLALATSRSSNHMCMYRGELLTWLFLVVVANDFDLGRFQNNHVITAAALLAPTARPPVLAEAATAAVLACAALPPVLADTTAAALLAAAALPPVLAEATAAAVLAPAALPPVLAEATAAALLAPAAPPPVLA